MSRRKHKGVSATKEFLVPKRQSVLETSLFWAAIAFAITFVAFAPVRYWEFIYFDDNV
jgi:hypothetical protein